MIDNSEASPFVLILYYVEVHYNVRCPHADDDEYEMGMNGMG